MTGTYAILTCLRSDAGPRVAGISDMLLSTGLRELRRSGRCIVFVSPAAQVQTTAAGVLVLGRLHERKTQRRPVRGSDGERPAERAARSLTRTVWGEYVAFFDMEDDPHVMVDPSGAGRAYEMIDDGVSLVCDHVTPHVMDRSGFDRAVDLEALHGCLVDPTTALQAKVVRGVERLVPGRLYSLLERRPPVTIWSPSMIAERRDDPERRLRDALDEVLAGMVGERPLIQLSGGLDSSIVVGSLSLIRPMTQAMTATSAAGDAEETPYARSAAAHAGVRLIEKSSDGYPDYRTFCSAPQIAHPYLHGLDDLFGTDVEEAGMDAGADLVVTGQGGDATFFHPASPLVGVDRRRALGSWVAWRSLVDDARRSRSTVWHHLIPSELDRIRHAKPPIDSLVPPWLIGRDPRLGPVPRHLWTSDARTMPPGKQLHVMLLANSQIFHSERPFPGAMPLHHPLLSQPVMEEALSIPVWMLATGPLNRGLARRAFASRIPADVARRRSKGEATAFYGRAAAKNLVFLREHLMGGALVASGIVDAGRIEEMLTPERLFYSPYNHSLILLASCEAWLRSWR